MTISLMSQITEIYQNDSCVIFVREPADPDVQEPRWLTVSKFRLEGIAKNISVLLKLGEIETKDYLKSETYSLADPGGAAARAPQQDQFLSFSHTFSPKSVRIRGWRPPPNGSAPPPTGNPGSATGIRY